MGKQHSPGFLALVNDARQRIEECSIEDVRTWLDRGESITLIDVREDHEYEAGHLAGARHLGRGILERDIETTIPDHDARLVLYCGGGYRSALAADSLRRMGYTGVRSMWGGFTGWKEAGLPIES